MAKRKWRTIGLGLLLSGLVCGLGCLLCLRSNPLERLQQYQLQADLAYTNRLDQVVGQVESLFLAEDKKRHPSLSPDGWWLAVTEASQTDGDQELWMMEVESYRFYNLGNIVGGTWQWLDNHHFRTGYTLVRVPELKHWSLERLSLDEDPTALSHLAPVSQVLAIEGQLAVSYVVISSDPQYPYIINIRAENETELALKLGNIPHTIVPESIWRTGRGIGYTREYSPDGRYFVSGGRYSAEEQTYHPQSQELSSESMIHPTGIIFEAGTEKMVAMAIKKGWGSRVLGWAPDSSGVYLQFTQKGGGYRW